MCTNLLLDINWSKFYSYIWFNSMQEYVSEQFTISATNSHERISHLSAKAADGQDSWLEPPPHYKVHYF